MQVSLLIQVLALLVIANGTPVLAKKVFGSTWGWPLDAGVAFIDGQADFRTDQNHPRDRNLGNSHVIMRDSYRSRMESWSSNRDFGHARRPAFQLREAKASSRVKQHGHWSRSSSRVPLAFPGLPVASAHKFCRHRCGTATFILGALLLSPLLFKLGLRDEPH